MTGRNKYRYMSDPQLLQLFDQESRDQTGSYMAMEKLAVREMMLRWRQAKRTPRRARKKKADAQA